MAGLTLEYYTPPPRCESMRGFRRSKIRCEGPADHLSNPLMENVHMGRGKIGQWYTWSDKLEFIDIDNFGLDKHPLR